MSVRDGTVVSPLLQVLAEPVQRVLAQAASIVQDRSTAPISVEAVLADVEGLGRLLDLLSGAPGLRAVLRTGLDSDADRQDLSWGLCDADPDVANAAVETVRRKLAATRRSARTESSRARRTARSEARPTAEERTAERAQQRLERLREVRDHARHQTQIAEAVASALRADLSALNEDLATVQAQVLAERSLTQAARADLTSLGTLCINLADLLFPSEPDSVGSDVRGIGPGEPERINPGRGLSSASEPAPEAVSALLERCAGLSDVPADAALTLPLWLPKLLRMLATPPRPPVFTHERQARVEVLGGGAEIGGSCVLVTAAGTRILVDAGTRPGGYDADTLAPPRIAEALAEPLDAIVITHAHNDHAGWVPAVLAAQPNVPVFLTEPTAALLGTMWFDSAKVLARRSQPGDLAPGDTVAGPAYERADVVHALRSLVTLRWGQVRQVGDVELELFPAGHIVGAAGVVIRAADQRVVISGDVSRPGQKTVGGILIPDSARGADLLLLESTYGAMTRPVPRAASVAQFIRDVSRVVESGGRVLVPAFALGRAQEVALVLAEHLPEVDVLIDGLARDVSTVYEQQSGPDGGPMRIFGERVRAVPPGGTHAEVNRLRCGVVIATSGMLTAGPAVSWARALLPDPRAGLMVVGYQDEESPGGRLLALAKAGGGLFDLPTSFGGTEQVAVAATVASYGLGAHATADELVSIATDIDAERVMLVHGESNSQRSLRARLELRRQASASVHGVTFL